ncbi:MAG: acetyl-CoA C-acetyltransferase [Anaerolineae bacterium]|nr:acetyl-CoA C-acetyltransferase [Anaerolineae bacterium]MCO5191814.1 acetyl-CoA C-acetyltransferase [Anaerolineae bacterium]
MTTEAYIFDAIRTPRGRGKETGALHMTSAIDLLTELMTALVGRNDLDTSQVEDVILGCVTPIAEQGGNIARIAPLYADWHVDVPGIQVNRFCASGLSAVNDAAMRVRAGWGDLVVAGGIESMSRVKMGSDGGAWMTDKTVIEKVAFVPQGISADLIATLEGLTRADVDGFALLSQQRAAEAEACGYFTSRIAVQDADGTIILDRDEYARPDTTLETLGALRPAFQQMGENLFDAMALRKYPQVDHIEHVHTAGNSSGIVDGAALVLVGSAEKGRQLNLTPRARIVSAALVGTEPTIMLIGPAPASQKALQMAGMKIDDIDLIECNEAFAAVPLRFMREMGLDSAEKVNVNGGAIALGHPLGATGAMLLGTALDELERRDKETALITLCAGGGMGIATIIERV